MDRGRRTGSDGSRSRPQQRIAEDDEREWFPSPQTSFLEDYRREIYNTPRRSRTDLVLSPPLGYYNTDDSLQRSDVATSQEKNNSFGFGESSWFDANLTLDPPYPPYEAPPRLSMTHEDDRRAYTPFPRLQTPPQQHPPSRRRRVSNDSLFESSTDTPHSSANNAFVDLTEDSPIIPPSRRLNQFHQNAVNRDSSEPPSRSTQRQKKRKVKSEIEEVDLRDVGSDDELARVLEKQRVATVKAQMDQADKPTKLAGLNCVVCMDNMTNVTATHCGHLFCHTCLMEALIVGENNASEPGKGASKCPICRKKVKRPKDRHDKAQTIPLEIMKKPKGAKGKAV